MDREEKERKERAARLRYARGKFSPYDSAYAAARAMRVNEATYSGHENGTRGFNAGQALKYATFYKISLQWLLYEFGSPRGPDLMDKVVALSPDRRKDAERHIDWLLEQERRERQVAREAD